MKNGETKNSGNGGSRSAARGALALACIAMMGSGSALAQTPPAVQQIAAAVYLGKFDVAKRLIISLPPSEQSDSEVLFLKGLAQVGSRQYKTAVITLHQVLDRDPSANRVRLEIARAYMLDGDYEAATDMFQRAQAEGLPPTVQQHVNQDLAIIRSLKRFTGSFYINFEPNTNINAATEANQVSLFGLPFALAKTARQETGYGVTAGGAASYELPLAPHVYLELGADGYLTKYTSHGFDDFYGELFAGPRYVWGRGEVALLATGDKRLYNEQSYTTSTGARIEIEQSIGTHIDAKLSLGMKDVSYAKVYEVYAGPVATVNPTLSYAIDESTIVQLSPIFLRDNAKNAGLRFTEMGTGLNLCRENLPLGLTVGVSLFAAEAKYDGFLAAFGTTRMDHEYDASITVATRRLEWHGFTPTLTYQHTTHISNEGLYSYDRDVAEVGIQRLF